MKRVIHEKIDFLEKKCYLRGVQLIKFVTHVLFIPMLS